LLSKDKKKKKNWADPFLGKENEVETRLDRENLKMQHQFEKFWETQVEHPKQILPTKWAPGWVELPRFHQLCWIHSST
jgi:hypothetical protein